MDKEESVVSAVTLAYVRNKLGLIIKELEEGANLQHKMGMLAVVPLERIVEELKQLKNLLSTTPTIEKQNHTS